MYNHALFSHSNPAIILFGIICSNFDNYLMHITIILKTVVMFAGKIKRIFLRFMSAYVANRNTITNCLHCSI